jgi:ComF family protein
VGARVDVADLLLPRRCVACGAGEELLCAACRSGLTVVRGPLCSRCGAPTAWPVDRCVECSGRRLAYATARAAVVYEGVARLLVAAWKERGLRKLADVAAELVAAVVWPPAADVLTFVPGDRERTRRRGQNPAEALARALGPRWQLPLRPLLERTRTLAPQRGLSGGARRANVRAAFRAGLEPPPRVVLVDDVYTTGATVAAAASELRRAGAKAVHVVTFARAARR